MTTLSYDHPDMTPQRAQQILPDGCVAVPLPLLMSIGELLDEKRYDEVPAKVYVRQISDALHAALDVSLRRAQENKGVTS